METKEQIHEITKQVNEIQQTVHRHMDYNRKMNGERIVLKKEQEMFIQSIRKTLKQISHVLLYQSEEIKLLKEYINIKTHNNPTYKLKHAFYSVLLTISHLP